jgi:DNA repair protein RadC
MPSPTIRELPEADRPREKLVKNGPATLTDTELIAILLRTGMKGMSAIDLGRDLLGRYHSLGALARASVKELTKIKGVGPTKAIQLAAAFGLATRLAHETVAKRKIDSPELVWDLLGAEMRLLRKESLRTILLDTKYQLIDTVEISLGSLNESIAHPREIFRPALLHSAYALIVVHNHPSGDPAPSTADHQLTRRLREAALLLQIQLVDHVILGSADNGRQPWFSFKESGAL